MMKSRGPWEVSAWEIDRVGLERFFWRVWKAWLEGEGGGNAPHRMRRWS